MSSSPNPDEAAAIAAAIERFSADLAPAGDREAERVGAWQRAALLEGVGAKRTVVDLEGEGGAKWLS